MPGRHGKSAPGTQISGGYIDARKGIAADGQHKTATWNDALDDAGCPAFAFKLLISLGTGD